MFDEIEALSPEKWPQGEKVPWLKGEENIISLCKRFIINSTGNINSYREFFSDPRTIPLPIDERLLKGFLQIIPVSSSEPERGFSQMNLINTNLRSNLTVPHLSLLMFISINGPPVHLWDINSAVRKWLEVHSSANENQTRKCKKITVEDLNQLQKLFAIWIK